MKKIISLVTTIFLLTHYSTAQERHTVLSITQEMHDIGWYLEQQALWSDDVKKDKTNAEAWYNYYSATRAIKNLSEDKEEREKYREEGHKVAEDAYAAVPNSFEANHLMWWDGNNDMTKKKYLLEAARIAPNDNRAFDDLMIIYEITGDKKGFDGMCQKIYECQELPASILNWGYNVLSELEPNAVLFVYGDNDTYSVWITQSVKKIRTDVTIVNTSLMQMEDYRTKVFNELGYSGFEGKDHEVFQFMIDNRKELPIHVATSAIRPFKKISVIDNLYLVGLTYLYSDKEFDNVSIIKRNYEKRFLIDYLVERFSVHPSDGIASHFNGLYIPSMIKLYKHYRDSEETSKQKQIEKLLLKISEETGQEDRVKSMISHK